MSNLHSSKRPLNRIATTATPALVPRQFRRVAKRTTQNRTRDNPATDRARTVQSLRAEPGAAPAPTDKSDGSPKSPAAIPLHRLALLTTRFLSKAAGLCAFCWHPAPNAQQSRVVSQWHAQAAYW